MPGESRRASGHGGFFCIGDGIEFYGLSGQVHRSRLADIPESAYRSPDIDRARTSDAFAQA